MTPSSSALRLARALGVGALFLAVNGLQAWTTELTSDEGYYAYLSTRLQWGYYDHPPLLPALVHLGRSLVPGELGVRLGGMGVLAAGLAVLAWMARPGPRIVLLILASPLLHWLSFVTFPDTPLLGLCLVAWALYRRLLERESVPVALGLGVVLAAMVYAKYHALLLAGLVVLSHPSLLRRPGFLAAGALAGVLLVPHLLWQADHGWVTVRYQLLGRATPFRVGYLLEYLATQPLLLGPALVLAPWFRRARDPFERSLQWAAGGTLLFFLVSTLRGYVHLHWTSIALPPLLLLADRAWPERSRALAWLAGVPLVLVLGARVWLAWDGGARTVNGVDWFHGRPAWARTLAEVAGDRPVIFEGQLREAPLYAFYAGRDGVAIYGGEDKRSQYDLWGEEDRLQGRAVVVSKGRPCSGCRALSTPMGQEVYLREVESLATHANVRVDLEARPTPEGLDLRLTVHNHRTSPLAFLPAPDGTPVALVGRFTAGSRRTGRIRLRELGPDDAIPAGQAATFDVRVPWSSLPEGSTEVAPGFEDGILEPTVNGPRVGVGPVP